MLAALAAIAFVTTAGSPICSLVPFVPFRDSSATYLVGTALPDTVAAGPGTTRPSESGGHWGAGRARPIFGQVIWVDRLAGVESPVLEHAFAKLGRREVVVVPWDYGPDCRPVIWGRSFRWVQSEAPGFYRLRVRQAVDWASGRPVLDAFSGDLQPYPHGLFYQHGYRGTDAVRSGPALTPTEYFAFYSALPSTTVARERPAEARAILDGIERTHPELAAKYPASAALQLARRILDHSTPGSKRQP